MTWFKVKTETQTQKESAENGKRHLLSGWRVPGSQFGNLFTWSHVSLKVELRTDVIYCWRWGQVELNICSRSWNLQRAAQGWNPYLSALRFLSITHFSTGLGYFATKYLGDCLEPVLWSPLLPGSHPHLVEWSWFTLLRRQASYPSTEAGGSRRPELAERLNLGIFLLHEISFRTFGPLGLPQIANC